VENGLRHARIYIDEPIRSFLRVGKITFGTRYYGQESTCKKCNEAGHYARSCNEYMCYNCEEIGHTTSRCTKAEKCLLCESSDHTADVCRYNWTYDPGPTPSEENQENPNPDEEEDTNPDQDINEATNTTEIETPNETNTQYD
jgi:hypothetical protein